MLFSCNQTYVAYFTMLMIIVRYALIFSPEDSTKVCRTCWDQLLE